VDRARAPALLLLLLTLAVGGAVARRPREGRPLPDCATPTRDGVFVRCDGTHGDPPGGRAWLFGQKLDVNAATAAQLERIPGVGRSLAERIVAERGRRGPFAHIDELDAVEGVGDKMLQRLRAYVAVR
jgi:competence protein ComEA